MSQLHSWPRKCISFLNQPRVEILLVFLLAVIVLRLPNFSEPYWYGDEGIYLTIGNALRHGARLYVDIVDHKTPIIYYLAMVPNQFTFRLLLLVWMLITTTLFYRISLKLFTGLWPTIMATAGFVIFTTLPWLEGNIPNGELFVMGFVLAGAALLLEIDFFKTETLKKRGLVLTAVAGGFFGLGVLTKVPAIFDWAAFFAGSWFSLSHLFFTEGKKTARVFLPTWFKRQGIFLAGGLVLVLLSVIYFVLRGSGQAYLDFGLLYNFRYAGNWTLPFDQPWLLFLFSLPGKAILTLIIGILLTFSTKKFKPLWATLVMWVVLALFASTLSNRPYPHYFMQVVPPVALLVGYLTELVVQRKRATLKTSLIPIAGSLLAFLMVVSTWQILHFNRYPTWNYYSDFAQLMTGQMSAPDYANTFNSIVSENSQITTTLNTTSDPYLLIWGTNPMLYALSGKQPVGRFTVAFHIKDFDAYQETLDALIEKNPRYVVVMKNDQNSFPALNHYLEINYLANPNYDQMTLWRRR